MPTLTADPAVHTVAFVSLGCPKNLVDSEKMLGTLAASGVVPVSEDDEPDTLVINTCGFLEASKEESLEEIAKASEAKRAGRLGRIVVAGCLVQRHRAKILEWCPDVDALIGVFDRDRVVEAVRGPRVPSKAGRDAAVELPVYSSIAANATLAKAARHLEGPGSEGYFEDDGGRLRLTPRHWAYLRISEGCNQNCAFCTIPSIRGKMRSKPIDRLLAEARELIEDGAQELSLIGQDTTSYGDDLHIAPGLPGALPPASRGLYGFAGMLTRLNAVAAEGGTWLRMMYAYPSCFTDEMVDAIASLPHVLPYIDMPLQHIDDDVLDAMRRRTSAELIRTLLGKLRDRGIAVRTTFISGFPGETEDQHQRLVEFVEEGWFEHMGVFPYSPEPGTPAGRMFDAGGAVDDAVTQRRIDELMSAQQQVVFDRNAERAAAGIELDVLVDEAVETETGQTLYAGRTAYQAPQIDTVTYVDSREPLSPGEVVRCQVTDWSEYDLIAKPVAEVRVKARLSVVS